jgi:hypothetical protein
MFGVTTVGAVTVLTSAVLLRVFGGLERGSGVRRDSFEVFLYEQWAVGVSITVDSDSKNSSRCWNSETIRQ